MNDHFRIDKGLDLHLSGSPRQIVSSGAPVSTVALLGTDFPGVALRSLVEPDQRVRLGDPLLIDKRNPMVRFCAPGSGRVVSINRGYRRRLLSVEIELDEANTSPPEFPIPATFKPDSARELLLTTGAWTGFRTRPFNAVPDPGTNPGAIFITAMDTRPLAADPKVVLAHYPEEFALGVQLVSQLAEVPVYLCTDAAWRGHDAIAAKVSRITFEGPHPAGLPGTHMHFLYPVSRDRQAWHIGYQQVIAIGHLLKTGTLMTERVVALGGPGVSNPRLLQTRAGANLKELVRDELRSDASCQLISGSVLDGTHAEEPLHYLGYFHNQVSVLPERDPVKLFGWLGPGPVLRSWGRSLLRRSRTLDTTDLAEAQYGRRVAMMPTENFERVMPLDILPAPLLRALLVEDTEAAQQLGCLELAEEDLALCAYVCPARQDYAAALRQNLTLIEEEG